MPIKGIKGGVGTKALGYGLGAAEEASEPHFNQTTLLLHADGSEGEGNTSALGSPNYKAFRDNSTSAHALVVQGDAYGNDFSPYYYADGYWSVESATQGMFSFTQTADFSLDGDFTIEGWFWSRNKTADTQWQTIYFDGTPTTGTQIAIESTNGHLILYKSGIVLTTTTAPSSNTWHHFAIVRSGSGSNNLSLYVDGTRVEQDTSTATFGNSSGTGYIGSYSTSGGRWNGYLSNIRFVKGTAVYSGASHTVPTTPLTAITNTEFLVNQSNRFIDNSTNSTSLTIVGTPKVSTNTPFTQTKTANVGSGFFDGTGDELEITNSSDFAFGTGDFQISLWVYLLENSGGLVGLTGGTATGYWALTANSGTLYFQKAHNTTDVFSTTLPSLHAWHFIEVSRVSGTTKMFIDGVQTNTASDTTDYNQTGQTLDIGDHGGHGEPKGYIADVRIIKGSGVTSSTLPTTSLTAVTNTKLLTCQYSGAVRNVGFLDDSKYNHRVTRIGDVSMGTFSPFSLEDRYWSTYHDTASDAWVRFAGSGATDFNLDDGANWCVEFFLYMEDNSVAYERVAEHYNSADYWAIKFNDGGNGKICIGRTDTGDNGVLESASAIPENQWVHVAFTNDGSTLRLFVDGTLSNSASSWTQPWSNASGGTPSVQLGNYRSINGYQTRGYISNFRIVKGSSVYTSAFTVPTEPLTAIANTVLLCSQSNRHLDNSTNGYTATSGAATPPKILPFSPFAPSRSYSKDAVGGSAYFDGTTDGLVLTDATQPIGANNFEVEFWYYPIGTTNNGYVFNTSHNNSSFGPILIYIVSLDVRLYSSSTGSGWNVQNHLSLGTAKANSWNHIYLSRVSNAFYGFVNGVASASNGTTWNTNFTIATAPVHISTYDSSGSGSAYGYVANVQYNIGSGSTTKSVPTAPTTPDSNTYVQLNFDNAGIIDHTMKSNLETEGNTRIRTDVKKFGTGSIYLDGSDELNVPAGNKQIDFETGQFTVEAFIRVESGSGSLGQWFTNEGEAGGWGSGGIAVYLQSSFTVWVNDASSGSNIMSYDGNYDDGVMRHYVWVRGTSGAMALFVDGTRVATYTWTGKVGTDIGFTIGNYKGGSRNLTGFIDEMRITKGVARYDPSQSSVTVPTKAFANR